MDSGTHLVIGLGLAGLAAVDPVVAGDPDIFGAVMIGTVVGSQAPDFDGLIRFMGNAAYIRNHRGKSHSFPAVLIWACLLTLALQLAYHGSLPLLHVGAWVLLAVSLHVLTDMFNTYGTQAYWPVSDKWVRWNIIHIFDPVIFLTHLAALLLWASETARPSLVFPWLYSLLVMYYIGRTLQHRAAERLAIRMDATFTDGDRYTVIPTLTIQDWNIVKRRSDGGFAIGHLKGRTLTWMENVRSAEHPAVEASKQHADVKAFLYFTSFTYVEVRSYEWGYEVRWSDVRFRYRKQYPFVAVVVMDKDYVTLGSYIGWLSEKRLEKRLRLNSY
ncbi:metal-dependent hydrolase [Paenibacillus tarimensis]|uniref:metal-dependent hydrolase n=1 Tax=Paenibacillus tarimensis TaxID=416012 RepID=UPI001F20EBC3|nr:metal-dependent hydrolase [Paenibacillus tarimensis]MCF2943748.1 metal-dependent hydrolase [Paenibacillus tarimensis]